MDGLGVAFDGFGESALSLVEDAPGKDKKVQLEWKKNQSKNRYQAANYKSEMDELICMKLSGVDMGDGVPGPS